MITNPTKSIRDNEAKRRGYLRAAWVKLVCDVCDAEQSGQQVDKEDVSQRLASIGKSHDELAAAVALKKRRREACATIERARQAQAERKEVYGAIERKREERDAALAAANAELEALHGQLVELSGLAEGEAGALQLLQETADPCVAGELRAAIDKRGKLLSGLARFDRDLERQRADARQARERVAKRLRDDLLSRSTPPSEEAIEHDAAKAAAEAAAPFEAEIAATEQEQARARSDVAEADARVKALEVRVLEA